MIEAFGWFCGVVGLTVAFPQIFRIISARTTAGVSLLLWQFNLGAVLAWTLHGSYTQRANLIYPNGALAITQMIVVYLIWRDRKLRVFSTLWPVLTLAALLTTVEITSGEFSFGVAAAAPTLVGLFAQLKDLILSVDISGVSAGMLALLVGQQGLWFMWGMLAGDRAVQASAFLLTLVGLIDLVVCVLRNSRRMQPSAPVVTPNADVGESG